MPSHEGFERLLDRLRNLSDDSRIFKIGIETPHNLLVDYLVDLDYPVFAIFPVSMKSFRKRYRSSGARDDKFDSFVLADVLRIPTSRDWREVDFGSELIREIRLFARDHHRLGEEHVALSNPEAQGVAEYDFLSF